jgi:hypothetical protein
MSQLTEQEFMERHRAALTQEAEARALCWGVLAALLGLVFFLLLGAALLGAGALLAHVVNG